MAIKYFFIYLLAFILAERVCGCIMALDKNISINTKNRVETKKMKPKITICMGSSCFARGNEKNLAVIEKFMNDRGLQDEIDLELGCSLCKERCSSGPNITVDGKEYHSVDTGMMYEILKELFRGAPGGE